MVGSLICSNRATAEVIVLEEALCMQDHGDLTTRMCTLITADV